MLWYSLIIGMISSVLICIASTKFHKMLPEKNAYALGKVTVLPMGTAAAGAVVQVVAVFYGLPYATAPWEPETVGVILIGAGAWLGLLSAVVGWLISRRNHGGWLARRQCKKVSGWGFCILLYAVAAIIATVHFFVDWLFT